MFNDDRCLYTAMVDNGSNAKFVVTVDDTTGRRVSEALHWTLHCSAKTAFRPSAFSWEDK